jgi:MFS family permease
VRFRSAFEPLRERNFRRVFLAQVTSMVGDNVAPVAVAFAVLGLTRSPSALGIVLAARTLPMVLAFLAGGVWADRVSRHRLMVGADVTRLVTQGAFAALLLTGSAHVWQIVVLQALNGVGTALFRPASTGLTPQIVSSERLQQANALLSLSGSAASIAGPVIAGVLVAVAGAGWAIALDAGTFAVSALLLAGVRIAGRVRAVASFRDDLSEGWRQVRSREWLWVMILVFAAFQVLVLATWQVLGPTVAQRDLGGAGAWAAITACWGAGAVLGAALALRMQPRRPLLACNLSVCLIGPAMILLGTAAPTVAIAAAAVPAGASIAFASILWETALQEHVDDASLSRVAAYDWLGSTALRPIGYAVVGSIAATAGLGATLIASAVAMVAIQLAAAALPSVRSLPRGAARVG